MPDAIENAPSLLLGLDYYFDAFWQLSTERQVGMALGQIPWEKMRKYADYERMSDDDFDRFEYLLRRMDDVWLAKQAEKSKKAAAGNKEPE